MKRHWLPQLIKGLFLVQCCASQFFFPNPALTPPLHIL